MLQQRALPPQKKLKSILIIVNILKEDINLFSKVALGAIEVANELGYNYYIVNTGDFEKRNIILRSLNLNDYCGAILTAFDTELDRDMLKILEEAGIKYVLVDNPLEKGVYSYVVFDDYAGGYMIGDYLGNLGHKKIILVSTTNHANTVYNRFHGICDGLQKHGITVNEKETVYVDENEKTSEVLVDIFKGMDLNCTAFAVCNDAIAISTLRALTYLGYKIPEDFSITGFGGYIAPQLSSIQLTTVKTSGYLMGKKATELLLDTLINNPDKCSKMILDVAMEYGNTTGTPKN